MRSWVCLALAAAAIASCGGDAFETVAASGGSSGTSGSAGGGAGGKGGSGGSQTTGGSSGTSGVGGGSGSGGTGGTVVEDRSCTTDSDCVLGYRALLCCADCLRAMSRTFADQEPCYCVQQETCDAPATCQEDPCPPGCPAIGCPAVTGVKCDQGVCTEVYSGTGGTGGATGGTGGTGGVCADLSAEYDALVVEARACNPDGTVPQCTGQTTVPDRCGCPIVLNDSSPASADAQNMYQQWVDSGCGPFVCGIACVAATSSSCQPEAGSSGYACVWGP
jgi:hypothetical protein